jgi:SIR2-like domain
MSKKITTDFPPDYIQDLSTFSASNFMALLRSCKENNVAFILGAGVSTSAGLPAWEQLLRRICGAFFYHWEFLIAQKKNTSEKPPREMSIAFAHEYMWSNESIEMAELFIKGDSLLVAQQIKNCIRDLDWKWLLRRALYDDEDENRHTGKVSPLIETIGKLCAFPLIKVTSIINYNYDDLFERCLKNLNVNYKTIFSKPQVIRSGVLPIYHPHGFLPLEGGPDNTQFVLAETDYHQHVAEPHAWSNLVQLQSFTSSSCIFIGASLKDPAMRRMLRLAQTSHRRVHFAFLAISTPRTSRNSMFDALFDRDALELGVKIIRYDSEQKGNAPHSRLVELLEILLSK